MKNSALQQSLVELEESLKSLESARTQVEKVSNKGEQITIAFTKILTQIESLQSEFSREKGYFKEIVGDSIGEFNSSLKTSNKEILNSNENYSQNLKKSITETVSRLHAFQRTIDEKSEEISKINFDKKIKELKSDLEMLNGRFTNLNKELADNNSEVLSRFEMQNNVLVNNNIEVLNRIEMNNKAQKKQSIISLSIISILGFIAFITLLVILR